MRKWNSEQGMSLVEATIILMVLAILTSVVSPSIADYVNDSRQVKAKEDVEVLGTGILRLLRDTGKPCVVRSAAAACTKTNRVELLISGGIAGGTAVAGEIDSASLGTVSTSGAIPGGADAANSATLDWGGAGANRPSPTQTFDQHLVTNSLDPTSYSPVSFTAGGGPRAGLGWRGAYVSGPVGFDPWGRRYQSNTVFLSIATNSTVGTTTDEGGSEGGWARDTIVLSSGANGLVETAFVGTTGGGAIAGGDDVIYVMKGSTR